MTAALLRMTIVLGVSHQWAFDPTFSSLNPIVTCSDKYLVDIVVRNAVVVQLMFSKVFWTGNYGTRGGVRQEPSENSDNPEQGLEMKRKRSQSSKKKKKKHCSITAAMLGDDTFRTH